MRSAHCALACYKVELREQIYLIHNNNNRCRLTNMLLINSADDKNQVLVAARLVWPTCVNMG